MKQATGNLEKPSRIKELRKDCCKNENYSC